MAYTTNSQFLNGLIDQLLLNLKSKIEQLNARKLLLEQYLSLNLIETSEIDLAIARAKLEEVNDSLKFEERFEQHFAQIGDDLNVYKDLFESKQKLEREENVRHSLQYGFEYLDALNMLFSCSNPNNIPVDLLKCYDIILSDYLALKSFNQLLQSERKHYFDVNVDHLASLVNGSTAIVKTLNYKYSDIKIILDRIIKRKNLFTKYSTRPISPITINSNMTSNSYFNKMTLNVSENNLNTVTSIPIRINPTPENNESILSLTPNNMKSVSTVEVNSNSRSYRSESKENDINMTILEPDQERPQTDVVYNDTNLTQIGREMGDSLTRESYAYTITKIIFTRDERLTGWFADPNNLHSAKNKRTPFDFERVKILRNAINSTKFKLSTDPVEANTEWNQLRRELNKKISKNLKKKSIIN